MSNVDIERKATTLDAVEIVLNSYMLTDEQKVRMAILLIEDMTKKREEEQ